MQRGFGRIGLGRVACLSGVMLAACWFTTDRAVATSAVPGSPTDEAEIAVLIEQLGSSDFVVREAATSQLTAIATEAIDQLLAAAEQQTDLEVALRARWILETVPLVQSTDPPAVAELLEDFSNKPLAEQLKVLSRLIRLEDNAGASPLARLTRIHRSPVISQLAAVVILQEWQPDDPHWPRLTIPVVAELAGSRRPAAQLLLALIDFSRLADAARPAETADLAGPLDRLAEAVEQFLDQTALPTGTLGGQPEAEAAGRKTDDPVTQLLRRCLARAMVQAGQTERGVASAAKLFQLIDQDNPGDETAELANVLFWAADAGLADLVDRLPDPVLDQLDDQPLLAYAAACCERARGRELAATELAQLAHERATDDLQQQLVAAIRLSHWGVADWSEREYERVLAADSLSPQASVQLAVSRAEFLNDQGLCLKAAAVLEEMLKGSHGTVPNTRVLESLGHSPRALAARRHYFLFRAAQQAGNAAAARQSLEDAIEASPGEIDSLIALYHLSDQTAADRERVRELIAAALGKLQQRIDSEPDEPNGYNEYAWLVANTEGDLAKATRYSKRSLEMSFDSASYLDTLAHCYAAAGRSEEAIRCQVVALRNEPGSVTIRKNLEKFLAMRP